MSLQDIELPILTLENAPADFAMVRDFKDAREAYRDPHYSHVFMPVPQDDESRAYIEARREEALAIAATSSAPRLSRSGAVSSMVRADNGQLVTGKLKADLPDTPGRDAFIARHAGLVSGFASVIRGNGHFSRYSLSNHNVDVLRPQEKQDCAHQDGSPVAVLTEFGPGTPVASVALLRQGMEANNWRVRRAMMEGRLVNTPEGPDYGRRPALQSIASCMFMVPPEMLGMLKPHLQHEGEAPAGYKASTHAFPWVTRRVPPPRDVRMRMLVS